MIDGTSDRESNASATAKPCKVFISYSHDSDDHKAWVLRLASDLRAKRVDATLDQWDLALGQDVAAFMQHGILEADRVLMVCSETYTMKAEAGSGGVGFERLIITAEVVQSVDTKKFIPLIRGNDSAVKIPRFLGPRVYVDFTNDALYETRLEDLVRELLGVPALAKPPLGASPFCQEARNTGEPTRVIGPMGITRSDPHVLDDEWFERQHGAAKNGIEALGLTGHMEVRFGLLHNGVFMSQAELLTAVQKSVIPTFGWSIAVLLDNCDEYRPRPFGDGIRAEVSIANDPFFGGKSYDYWTVKRNGNFFLLQSLFEDMRGDNLMFFNTRIVRVTEALLFASNLYANLNIRPGAKLTVRISHRGLAGRTLTSSNPRRFLRPKVSHEAESEAQTEVAIGSIKDDLVDLVHYFTQPLFTLFDFQEFPKEVYAEIVRQFEQGILS